MPGWNFIPTFSSSLSKLLEKRTDSLENTFLTRQLENSNKFAWNITTLCSKKFHTEIELVLEKERDPSNFNARSRVLFIIIPTFSILIVEIIGKTNQVFKEWWCLHVSEYCNLRDWLSLEKTSSSNSNQEDAYVQRFYRHSSNQKRINLLIREYDDPHAPSSWTYLNTGTGNAWAGHCNVWLWASRISYVRLLSIIENFGFAKPTGSRKRDDFLFRRMQNHLDIWSDDFCRSVSRISITSKETREVVGKLFEFTCHNHKLLSNVTSVRTIIFRIFTVKLIMHSPRVSVLETIEKETNKFPIIPHIHSSLFCDWQSSLIVFTIWSFFHQKILTCRYFSNDTSKILNSRQRMI